MKTNGCGGGKWVGLTVLLLSSFAILSGADPVDSRFQKSLDIIVGESEVINVYGLTRVSVLEPKIADVVTAEEKQIEVMGKEAGTTALFLWDENGKTVITINVFALEGSADLKDRLQRLFAAAKIKTVQLATNEKERKVVITGEVSAEQQPLFDLIIRPFADENKIVNLITVEKIEKQIQINMQVTEVNTSAIKDLGVDWQNVDGDSGAISLGYEEKMPKSDGSVLSPFNVGSFQRGNPLVATLNFLESKGEAQTISRPKIVVKNGEKAHFNVGGEIPIRNSTTSQTNTVESVEYKEYGVTLDISPTIKDGKIDIDLDLKISEVDPTNKIVGAAAFLTRTATTKLFLNNNQTIVLAGLIAKRRSENVKKVPFLGNVPIVGLFFRRQYNPELQKDTELVIALTPTILKEELTEEEQKASAPKQIYVIQPSLMKQEKKQFDLSQTKNIPKDMSGYINEVIQKVSQNMDYPAGAELYKWRGVVKVNTLIMKDGTLGFVVVRESSGFDLFDEHAVSVVKKSAPFSKFPIGVNKEDLELVIPISYQVK